MSTSCFQSKKSIVLSFLAGHIPFLAGHIQLYEDLVR